MDPNSLPVLALKRAIRGAVARGYCHEPNATKVLDPALCDAIASEVLAEVLLLCEGTPGVDMALRSGPAPLDNQSDLKRATMESPCEQNRPSLDNLDLNQSGCAAPTPTPFGGLEKLTCEERQNLRKAIDEAEAAARPANGILDYRPKPPSFRSALSSVINQYSRESGSDTPDFILAEYLDASLAAFDATVQERSRWYAGRDVSAWERRREERMEAMAVKAAKAAAANLQTPNHVAPVVV